MIHPIAEQARQALLSHRFSVARQLLNDALARGESDSDLLCEHLICESYFGNEEAAATRFHEVTTAPRKHDLQLLLSRYFHCRQLLARKRGTTDIPANDWLSANPYQPEDGVGIRISACLIAKNEAKILSACLDSLKGIVDEIVLVDTGSTDDTVAIAESYGAVIGHFPWINDFAAARNESLRLASGEWALWIDADEQLDPSCLTAFDKGIVRPHLGGYSIEIVNYLDDSGTTTEFVHNPTRLFRRIENVQFSEPIHEQITPSLMALGLPWTPLPDCRIHHDGYRQAALEEKKKVERTLSILEEVVKKNPDDPFQLFNLANTYFVQGDYKKAVQSAERCVQFMPSAGAEYGHAAFQVLISSVETLGNHEDALKWCEQCDKTAYKGVINEYLRSTVLLNMGRVEEAAKTCKASLAMEWPEGCIGDKGIADFRRHALYGQILGCLNRWDESLAMFNEALNRQPGFLPAHLGRAMAFEKLGRLTEAEADYRIAIADPRHTTLGYRGLGAIFQQQGDLANAAAAFEKAWRAQPNNVDVWNEWLAVLEQLGDTNAVHSGYQQFLDANESSAPLFVNWARFCERIGDVDRALGYYQEAMHLDPSDANVPFNFGDMLYRLGAYPQAAQVYELGLRMRMDFAEGWFVLGNCMAQMNHDQAAVQCYSQALVLDPAHSNAKANLATVSQAA